MQRLGLGGIGQRHGSGGVENEIKMRLHFLAEEFDGELIGASVGVPVDMAQVVARLVVAIILKIHGTACASAEVFAALAGKGGLRQGQRIPQAHLLTRDQGLAVIHY